MTKRDDAQGWKRYTSFPFLIGKLRERGVIWCLRAAVSILYGRLYMPLHIWGRPIRRLANLVRWFYPILRGSRSPVPESEKRVLAIWDFRVSPFTVGDLLICQEVSLVLRELHKVDKIDLILLCDAQDPARPDGGMDSLNFHYYFSQLLPTAFVNPHLGGLFVMDSPGMLANYISENQERYYIFPPYRDARGRELYDYWENFNYVQTFYNEHGYIPYLSCQPGMVMWARRFLADKVRPRLPVTLNLRNTSTALYRNAQLDSWIEFLHVCETRYPVTFVLLGDPNEIDPRFRQLPNILIAKDYGTTVEQDLALSQTAMFHMGTTSGITTLLIFSDQPYLIYGVRTVHEKLTPGQPLPWATALQRLVWEPETVDRLLADFTWLYEQIDATQWAHHFDCLADEARARMIRRLGPNGTVIQGLGQRNTSAHSEEAQP